MALTDEDILSLVRAESKSAIGLDNDETLRAERVQALKYYKGEMSDLPSLPNRSKAVSTDVADAIDTLHPDIVEIFTGGDDVMAFIPIGAEDEEQAEQETEAVNHVVFNENDGWQAIHDGTKDALQSKIGVFKAWVEECPPEEEEFEGKTAVEAQLASQNGELKDFKASEGEDPETPKLFDFKVVKPSYKRVKIACWPPEDFAIAPDTGRSLNGEGFTYCSARSRPRAQELIAGGFSKEKVDQIPAYGSSDNEVADARDTAGENDQPFVGTIGDLRRVEIVEHVIRVLDGSRSRLYSVTTSANCAVLLAKKELRRNCFSVITPYPVAHRLIGECPADRVVPKQRIRTALLRMMLDSGYFALNQRNEVAEDGTTANTLPDLMNNQPGGVVRVRRTGTVTPLVAGALSFDVFGALEYMATQVEQSTGVVRAAQGLTPDTLHDTAKGALALLTASQKRVKLIARNFAETGIKELFLNVHALLRENSDKPLKVRLRAGKWQDIDPTSWGSRSDMKIEIGLGASGREVDLMALENEGVLMDKLVTLQGGATGPLVTMDNLYNFSKRYLEKNGNKAPERLISNPEEAPPKEPAPDPKMIEAQAKAQEIQAKAQLAEQQALGDHELKAKAADADSQLKVRKAELDAETQRQLNALEMQAKAEQAAAELALKERVLVAEMALKERMNEQQLVIQREQNARQAELDRENNYARNEVTRESNFHKAQASADIGNVEVGGEPG